MLTGAASTSENLRQAVPGLAGLAGFVLIPTLAGWGKVALQMLERDRIGLGRRGGVSTLTAARAAGSTALLLFFTFTTLRAASDLRQLQLEAPVLALSLRGAAVGLALYTLYSAGWSLLRRGRARARATRGVERRLRWR